MKGLVLHSRHAGGIVIAGPHLVWSVQMNIQFVIMTTLICPTLKVPEYKQTWRPCVNQLNSQMKRLLYFSHL